MSQLPIDDMLLGPFTVAQARQAGITWAELQAKSWTRLSHGQYASTRLAHDVILKLRAAQDRMPHRSAFSGPTAGWFMRLDYPPCDPIEATIPPDSSARSRAGIKLRRARLPESDVVIRRGLRVTSPLRTVTDLASRKDLTAAVIAIDMATHSRLIDIPTLTRFVETHPGQKGIKRLRRALRLADPKAESPMETRLRLQLLLARLPAPCTQTKLRDAAGHLLGRADFYYGDRRLVIEYDGDIHRDRLVPDLRRQNSLVNAGFHVLRFTAADIYLPGFVAAQVRRARDLLPRYV
ncbi:MAG TPA: DUF559 domain-containing protein [Candidatus Dormibacteraeota bacterium]|nr:DUF559 domain-containing protein [Candidatus Dormibacteraeota bacterium]